MDREALLSDIPSAVASAAHYNTSHTPDERGEQDRAEYAATLTADHENLSKLANTDEKRAVLVGEFARYRAGYRDRFLRFLYSRARCASWFITGPSNFPTARNQKRNDIADRRWNDLKEYRGRALDAIRKTLCPELRPIMSGDSDAQARLREKIEKAEKTQETMKAVNLAIRKHAKAGREAQVVAIMAAGGFTKTSTAEKLLEPDFCGRIGFPDYELTNNNANIRRMKARLVGVARDQATPASEVEGANGIRLEDSPAENRIRLFFPGKPDASVRAALKSRGFRWAPTLGCWQAYRNTWSLEHAAKVAGATA